VSKRWGAMVRKNKNKRRKNIEQKRKKNTKYMGDG
jgi:hypothetical protein